MRTKSLSRAMLVVLSAMFEALPPQVRRRASILIEDGADLFDDIDAQRLLDTFQEPATDVPSEALSEQPAHLFPPPSLGDQILDFNSWLNKQLAPLH
jgi:hypothetical protein